MDSVWIQGSWSGVTGDWGKLGLSVVSIGFDAALIWQHYGVYGDVDPVSTNEEGEEETEGQEETRRRSQRRATMEAPVLRVEVKLRVLDSPTMMMKKEVGSSRANHLVCSDRHINEQEYRVLESARGCCKHCIICSIGISYRLRHAECRSVLLSLSFAFDTSGIEGKFKAATGRWWCCPLGRRW